MYRYLAMPTMKTVLSFQPVIGKWRAMLRRTQWLRFYLWRRLPRLGHKFNLFNSSRIDAINITEVRAKRRANNADPQSDRPVDGVSDELLWECKEDALALIRRDAPCLRILPATCLTRRCWINRPMVRSV